MTYIIGIDPGPSESGVVLYNSEDRSIRYASVLPNCDLKDELDGGWFTDYPDNCVPTVAIEFPCFYGKSCAIGKDVLDTAAVVGQFEEITRAWHPRRITRREVRMHLCGTMRSGDAQVWAAILDRYGGRKAAVGTKKAPGPLYGVRSHARSALAVALTAAETKGT
jgi:hypothetical protein